MNRLVVFDLDGVLIETKILHFDALNAALQEHCDGFQITWNLHLAKYDGLTTKSKLEELAKEGLIGRDSFEAIEKSKKAHTEKGLSSIKPNPAITALFATLKMEGFLLAVASNSIRSTVNQVLQGMELSEIIDFSLSNEDIENPKPHPEIYWRAMSKAGSLPQQTWILEDSAVGRRAALLSGANLIPVDRVEDLESLNIVKAFGKESVVLQPPWKAKNLNVLIPMAGAGSRFAEAGYTFPKPLIEVDGKAMIERVVENLNVEGTYIFLVRREHFEEYNLEPYLRLLKSRVEIVVVDELTEGAACTALLARNLIDNSAPLLIANSDQIVEWDSSEALYFFGAEGVDGGILTFRSHHPKWSFAKVNDEGWVSEVAEKLPISDQATTGIYYWSRGEDFVKYADQMISKNIRTNGEFYICPVYNEAILDGKKIKSKSVEKMWGIGTPEDLSAFLQDSAARQYISRADG